MNRETPDTEIRNAALNYALADQKQRMDKQTNYEACKVAGLDIDSLVSTAERFRRFLTPPQPSEAGNAQDTQPGVTLET